MKKIIKKILKELFKPEINLLSLIAVIAYESFVYDKKIPFEIHFWGMIISWLVYFLSLIFGKYIYKKLKK